MALNQLGQFRILRRPGFSIAAVLLIMASVVASVRACGPVVATTVAARTNLEQHLIASGRVRVVTRVELSSQIAGRAVAVRVVEGQRVRAGDLLVQLDDAEATAAISQARAAVSQASGRVEQLRKVGAILTTEASLQTATNLARAESELARAETLTAAGIVTRVDLDEARRNVAIAKAQSNAAEAQRTAAAPSGADSSIALSALAASQAELAGAVARLAQTRLVAPADGTILLRTVEPGHTVQPGRTLLEMAADGETQLVIEPDERNLAWIRLGQKARASADAYPQEVFDADVSYIAPSIDPQRGSIEVRVRVPAPPAFLKPDMTVSVDLTVASKTRALTLPSDAIRGAATPTPWVLAVAGGRLVRQYVTLGIRGEGHTEILSGLDEGSEVVIAADATLVDGQRVRVQRTER